MTGGERIEALDGQLNESFATFDAMILGERAAVAAIADSLPASATSPRGGGGGAEDGSGMGGDGMGGDGSGGGPLFEEGDLSEPGGPMAGGMDGGSGDDGDHSGGAQASTSTTAGLPGRGQGHGQVPPDLVDGSDDDIVARQIREAAMNEPDPALREKLWDEYRKYKTGS